MGWFSEPSEYEKWASPLGLARPRPHLGIPGLDPRSQAFYSKALPRNVLAPRFDADRKPENFWMPPHELAGHAWRPGQIMLGKLGNSYLGHLDDRPMMTIAGSRAGKTSTVLEPNLYLWPGSMVCLDPKGDLTRRAARLRQALGHKLYILDPFGASGEGSACFNPLAELDPYSDKLIDDVAGICQSIIVDEGDARSRHWNDTARTLLLGLILLTLLLPPEERNLVTVRQLLTLSHPRLLHAVRSARKASDTSPEHYNENRAAVETLLMAMTKVENRFGGVLPSIGNRFLATPTTERGSIFSTAAAQTDFLSSLPLQAISCRSSFRLADLRGDQPMTLILVLPVGRTESHYRWLRLIVQMTCQQMEAMGEPPRGSTPLLLFLEEFATLKHMAIIEAAAAYLPSFGVKPWIVLQDLQQLQHFYSKSFDTILGNSGLIQCFANNDQPTIEYLARRLEGLIHPFELRTAFARQNFSQILLMEGLPPAAAIRLEHEDVASIRAHAMAWARANLARDQVR